MASLRELMKQERLKRSLQPSVSETSSNADPEPDGNSASENKKVRFDEPVPIVEEKIIKAPEKITVEPKTIHEEYIIEDYQLDTSPTDGEQISQTVIEDSEDNDPVFHSSDSALLSNIKAEKEKWLKIAGLETFEYNEVDQPTLLRERAVVPKRPSDINEIIQKRIDNVVSKSKSSIVSSNFDVTVTDDINNTTANLPKGFFDNKDLDSKVRGEATKEEAIEKLKELVRLEKLITAQETSGNTPLIDEKENLVPESDDISSILKKQSEDIIRNAKSRENKGNIDTLMLDEDFELDWRARKLLI